MPALNEQSAAERNATEKASELQAPRGITRELALQKVAAKATATTTFTAATLTGSVTGVVYVPNEAIVQSATEPRTLTVINRGSAGVGSAAVATRSFTSTGSGQINNVIPLVASGVQLNVGDVLVIESHDAGATGTADPGGILKISTARATRVGSGGVANEATGYFASPGAITTGTGG